MKEELIELLFPAACLGCGVPGRLLCGLCTAALAGEVLTGDARLFEHAGPTPAFSGLRAACEYSGLVRRMVLGLKNSSRPLAVPLSRIMLAAAGNDPHYIAADQVCCVPSERKKVLQRGYNPAEMLADAVAKHLGMTVNNCLRKCRSTRDQDELSGVERWANVEGAFECRPGGLKGSVLLIDDVLTTGATADACAKALIGAGASSVRVLVAARTILRRG